MMAYKPPQESKSRIENIKKKFEVEDPSKSVTNGTSSSHPQNGEQYNSFSQNNYAPRGKSPSNIQTVSLDSDSSSSVRYSIYGKAERQLSSSSSKGNIRRSPAFRCDKIVRGRNMVSQTGSSWEKPKSVVDHRVKMFEDGQQNKKAPTRRLHSSLESKGGTSKGLPFEKNTVLETNTIETEEVKYVGDNLLLTDSNGQLEETSESHLKKRKGNDVSAYCISNTNLGYASVLKLSRPVPKLRNNKRSTEICIEKAEPGKEKHIKGRDLKNGTQLSNLCTKVSMPNESNNSHVGISISNTLKESEVLEIREKLKETETHESKCDNTGLTNTLKAALKAPLPEGPPPRKPPRTFAHSSPVTRTGSNSIQERIQNLNAVPKTMKKEITPLPVQLATNSKNILRNEELNVKPVRSKTESHIMLKKLEHVLLNHQQGIGGIVIKPRTPLLNSRKDNGVEELSIDDHFNSPTGKTGGRAGPLPSVPSESNLVSDTVKKTDVKQCFPEKQDNSAILGGCLDSLNCVSTSSPLYTQGHFYEKLNEKQSEFFVDVQTYLRSSVIDDLLLSSENQTISDVSQRPHNEEHIYAEPYAFLSDDEKLERVNKDKIFILSSEMKGLISRGNFNLAKAVSRSVEHLAPLEDTKLKTQALHYMCTAIPTVNPLDRIDALTHIEAQTNAAVEAVNPILCVSKQSDKPEFITPAVESFSEERNSSRRAPFLRLTSLVKNLQGSSSTEPVNKLDRTKIQLFINQAFGSPLQGMPVTPLDGVSSDCESISSSPDEGYPPVFGSEDECQADGVSKASSKGALGSEDSASIASSELSKLVEERKVYVRRVSSRVFNSCQRLSSPDSFPHLFQCIMLVGLNLDCEKRIKVPYIKTKYPPHVEVPPLIEHLCFPDAADWPPPSIPAEHLTNRGDEQSYSLVITNEAGDRKFGYCRRVMPEGANMCLPLAYCIISPFRAKGFYYKILSELESRHGQPEWLQTAFIKELYACEFPSPGQGLKMPTTNHCHTGHFDSPLGSIVSRLRRPLDTRLEERDLTQLFAALSVPTLLQVFGSLLLERKVLFTSSSLSKLSSCIEALQSILYPFSWQYTFIPVLPSTKLGVCEAPTPYVIGVLKGKDGKAPVISIDDGIIVDLEESRILQCVGDESTILPARLKRCLKMALQLVASTTQDHEPSRNVLVSEAFIRMFVEVCGHYPTHVVTQQDGKKVLERESFIKAVPSRSIQLFLEWFTETAMFSIFMDARLTDGAETKGIFEQRSMEHSEEMDKNTMLFLRNYKAINKKVKTFGDRLKDWTPFT